jgi:uncharacterized protein (AIM24 family)
MVSHEIDYKIFGDDIQFVEIELDPAETVIAEAGAMVYMEQGITFEVKMGDGSTPNQGLMGKLLPFYKSGACQKQGCLCRSLSGNNHTCRSQTGKQ